MAEIDVEFVEEIDADEQGERAGETNDIEAPEYVLYGGKGGVGKTTMAAATALASARKGIPTLVVSTDPAHSLADVLDRDVPREPAIVHSEYPLYGVEIDPDESDDAEEKGDFFGIGSPLNGLGPLGGGFGTLDSASDPFGAPMPGADEAAALRALLQYLDDDRFERVVVDTAPTGHTLRLLELPDRLDATLDRMVSFRERLDGMFSTFSGSSGPADFPGFSGFSGFGGSEADGVTGSGKADTTDGAGRAGAGGPDGGPFSRGGGAGLDDLRELRDRLALLEEAFSDPERTDFRVVVVPEKTSVVESRRLLDRLAAFDIPVGTIVVNRVMEDVGTVLGDDSGHGTDGSDRAGSDDVDQDEHDHEYRGGGGDELFIAPRPDSCPFCRRRLDSQMDALGDADDLFRGHSVKRVPLLASEVRGEELLRVVAACLA